MIKAKIGSDHHGNLSAKDKQLVINIFNKIATSLVEYDGDIRHNVVVALASWYLHTEITRSSDGPPNFIAFMEQVKYSIKNQRSQKRIENE